MFKSQIDKYTQDFKNAVDYAVSKGAQGAKLLFHHSAEDKIEFEAGIFKNGTAAERISFDITVLKNGRLGRVTGNRVSELKKLIDAALDLTADGSNAHFSNWPVPGTYADVQLFSAKAAALPVEQLIDACNVCCDSLRAYDPELYIEAKAGRRESETLLVTSTGICESEHESHWHLMPSVQKTEGTEMVNSWAYRSWNELDEKFSTDELIKEITFDLEHSKTAATLVSGKYPAILPPDLFQQFLLHPLQMGINGNNVIRAGSPLKEKLGQKILADSITVIDDPHVPFSPSSGKLDDDGIPTAPMTVIDKGVLKTFLYDYDTAFLAGVEPTGNAGCSFSNSIISPGSCPSEELIASVERGIYVQNMMGFGQGNIINGDFSANLALAFVIENGNIIGRIKDAMISGNSYDIFKDNVTLSSNLDWSGMAPYALAEGFHISSK